MNNHEKNFLNSADIHVYLVFHVVLVHKINEKLLYFVGEAYENAGTRKGHADAGC